MQNSQRARDAKPRTAPMARRRDGDIAPYRNGTAPRDTAKPRTAPMARRREPGGPAAKHRGLPQRDTRGVRGNGTGEGDARDCELQRDTRWVRQAARGGGRLYFFARGLYHGHRDVDASHIYSLLTPYSSNETDDCLLPSRRSCSCVDRLRIYADTGIRQKCRKDLLLHVLRDLSRVCRVWRRSHRERQIIDPLIG